jgi:uncharacterized protein (DUF1778 family)
MEKRVTIRLDEGTYLLIEANAKQQDQSVSDWIRAAIQEQVKRTVNSRLLDRIDERVYEVTKHVAEIKRIMAHGFGETKKGFIIIEKKIDGLVIEDEGE